MGNSEKKYIACDIGGTKIDAILFDGSGKILSHVIAPGGTILEIGMDAAADRYVRAIEDLLERGQTPRADAMYGAIACAGYSHGALKKILRQRIGAVDTMLIESDGPCLISGMLGHRDGAAMICGTGSSLCVRREGKSHYIGGWGYLVDSCGSGFILGRDAVRRAIREHDGRLPHTEMTELLERKCGEPVWEHLQKLYDGGRAYFASMADVVFEARANGDTAAAEIFNAGARDLADLALAARREFGCGYDLVLNGGIFAHYPEYSAAVTALCPPDVRVQMADVPPVYGAATEALALTGDAPDARFRENFFSEY